MAVKLIESSNQGSELTEAGKLLLAYAQRVLEETQEFMSILEEEDGILLLGSTSDGLLRFDTNKKQMTKYSNEATVDSYRIPNNYISSIIRTKSGEIWVSTYGGGIFQFDKTEHI